MSSKAVVWIELTSPWEENMTKRHYEKKNKYAQLASDLRNPRRAGGAWTVFPFEVEIGARGAIYEQPWLWMCKRLGFSTDARLRLTHAVQDAAVHLGFSTDARLCLTHAVQDAAVHCSHLIFICRFHKQWEPQPLLDTYSWYQPPASD